MFLRQLSLRGFKSFADRTVLEFTPGISVIVGPNGSGKSNLVDAIAWVLGEQGPRALRGGAMTDVIFAGSATRPPLGMAEVRLVIDNGAGLIPVPASEVEISRVLYRSGESEYRLGGRPCRLLDVQELLSDTGIGRALHTVVGQGQLDTILAARPEERRQLIEEAAGIAKHRRRRDRAERKLAGLEQDLLRLQDLLGELRRQLKPLREQAELARRHEALTEEAATLVRKVAAARLRDLLRERDRRRPQWEGAEARERELRDRLAALDREIAELEARRAEAEAERARAEEEHGAAVRRKSEAEDALRAAVREEARARERLARASSRSGRLFALEEELERTERALGEVTGALAAREAELEEAERAFREAERARREAEDERRRAEAEAVARRAEVETLRRALAGHEAELERLRAAARDLERRVGEREAREAALEEEIERLDALATPAGQEAARLGRERAELAARVSELEAEEKGLLARHKVAEARRRELSESPGAAFARRHAGRALGLLRDLVEAPAELAPALRAALGPYAEAVVYEREAEAVEDAARDGAGGVTLAFPPPGPVPVPTPIEGERRLLDLVRVDLRVSRLALRLIGNAYLAADLAEAAAKHRAHPQAQFVTPLGEVVGPSVVRTPPGDEGRLEEARREAGAVERELAAVRRGIREGRQRLAEVSRLLEEANRALEETDRAITAAAEEKARVQTELATLHRERELVEERVRAVEAAAAGVRDRLAQQPPAPVEPPPLPPHPEPPVRLRVEVEALRRERARLEAGVARARRDLEALRSEDPGALARALREAERARQEAEGRLREAEEALARAGEALRAARERERRVQAEADGANRRWRELAGEAERWREEHAEEDRARHDLERRVGEAERLLREGHGVEPERALAELSEEDTVEELERRREVVARRLQMVGRVNLLAAGELETLQARHDFLLRELEDVKAARRDLRELVRRIDREMAERFRSAFDDVAREFDALFRTMFPGGEGRLTLTDPDDPLGTGVEVEARPGRGRVRRLSLLSGGERALAALAFLFAIFRARPSPFYLLDEVEAALDDVNLHRFLEVIKAFARTSQVIIVTHQKRTMEVADALYGVSMGRDGVSTVISQRLVEAAAG
jgi:chromosome segregation protein